jgi:predicted nucleic acid-binding protein
MKLKIAVTDANIFIDLFDVGLIDTLFNLNLEIHTTEAVFYELYLEQQEVLNTFRYVGKLVVHNLQEQDFIEIYNENYPKSLSEADKSVLHVANRLNACVLSSDKTVRNYAKNKKIEFHGMLWLFDQFVETCSLSTADAGNKLKALVCSNFLYRNNHKLVDEIEKRIEIWG